MAWLETAMPIESFQRRSGRAGKTPTRARWPAAALLLHGVTCQALEVEALALEGLAPALSPNVIAHPDGGFVLSWQARLEAGCAALRVARLDTQGQLGEVHEVARGCDWFLNWADFPGLVIADNGDWLAWWLPKSGAGTYAYDVQVARSTDQGRSWSTPLIAHDDGTQTEHGFVSAAPIADDRVLLLWLDGRQTGGGDHDAGHEHAEHGEGQGGAMTLRTAVLGREGIEREAQALDVRVCDCCGTDVMRLADGSHVAVYRDRSAEEIRDIGLLRRVDGHWQTDGLVHADQWQIAACPVNGPALATDGTRSLAVWATMADQPNLQVRARRLDGPEGYITLEGGPGVSGRVDAVPFAGGWLVSWLGAGSEGRSVLRLARLDADLAESQREDPRDLPAGRDIGMPRLAANGDQAVLVWTEVDEVAPKVNGRSVTRLQGRLLR